MGGEYGRPIERIGDGKWGIDLILNGKERVAEGNGGRPPARRMNKKTLGLGFQNSNGPDRTGGPTCLSSVPFHQV
jgi:hypothetical protein